MSNGLKPNMQDTYGIMIETDISDHVFPYTVRIYDEEQDKIVASFGATDIHDLVAILTSEIRHYVHSH